jgi:hypothetical protein
VVEPHQRRLDEPGALVRSRHGAARLHYYWAYVVGPIAGALIAVGFAWILRGPGGGRSGAAAAQGRIGELRTTHDQD